MLDDEMLTIDDLAAYLKLKPQTIYKWAQAGKLPGAKFGKEWRFRRSAIERWIDSYIPPAEGPSPRKAPGGEPEEDLPGNGDAGEEKRRPAAVTRASAAKKARSKRPPRSRGPEAN